MWNKVKVFVQKYKLLDSSEIYLVALSGGADSVALLLMLHEAAYRVEAVHCNFHLRGKESDRDEQFCISLCEQLNIPLHLIHFDTQTYAETHKISIEMAARELRYRYFEQLRQDVGAAGVCVAHHRDDSVETVILNLVRGTGLRGLTGIQPKTGAILRPLLCVSRQEIEAFLQVKGQKYVTDSTNMEPDVLRNKVRLQVLPLLRTINPSVSECIQRTAENLSEAQKVLEGILHKYNDCNILEISDIWQGCSCEYVVFEWAKRYGFNGTQVKQILKAGTGSMFSSSAGYDLLVDRSRLVVEPSLKPMKPVVVPEEGTYVLSEDTRFLLRYEAAWISKTADRVTLDAEQICFPLTIRRVENGDWMIPYGMKGRRLLSNIMTDRKMTLFEKRRQLVVVDAQNTVLWLVGIRADNRFRVQKSTTRVLTIQKIDGQISKNI